MEPPCWAAPSEALMTFQPPAEGCSAPRPQSAARVQLSGRAEGNQTGLLCLVMSEPSPRRSPSHISTVWGVLWPLSRAPPSPNLILLLSTWARHCLSCGGKRAQSGASQTCVTCEPHQETVSSADSRAPLWTSGAPESALLTSARDCDVGCSRSVLGGVGE